MNENAANKVKLIQEGRACLGIELGSTRIKATLIDEANLPIASGSFEWQNELVNGIWTYALDNVATGLQACYADLKKDVESKFGVKLSKLAGIGISGMMHGYLAFDEAGNLLVPFRSWRNTITAEAAEQLSELFAFNIPQRWSVAHLYQAMLNKEDHVSKIAYMTTLAGYVHWQLTGEKVLGICDASGMFPVDEALHFQPEMVEKFNALPLVQEAGINLDKIFPQPLAAGASAGFLTETGRRFLDKTESLDLDIPFCPPEGDAGTGMVATNSVAPKTANISAGTSIFAMVVLEHNLKDYIPEIDLVATPGGSAVAMVHCNNCSSDIDAWVAHYKEVLALFGLKPDKNELYQRLYEHALEADSAAGGLVTYNYLSGEHITGFDSGCPLMLRPSGSQFTLANMLRALLYATFATLRIGMDILETHEHVVMEKILGHGGIFKTKGVAQSFLAAALNTPVSVMETAGEGGSWGIALLASYMVNKAEAESLADYLAEKVFQDQAISTIEPNEKDVAGFNQYLADFKKGLSVERAAVDSFNHN